MDIIKDVAEPLPAIVTAEMLGVSVEDRDRLKDWSADFAEMLGNFQHNPERAPVMLRTAQIKSLQAHPGLAAYGEVA